MCKLNIRSVVLLIALSPIAAVFAGSPLFVGISESFPPSDKSAKITVNASYAEAVAKGGHIPVVITRYGKDSDYDALVAKLDVLIMTGGEDFDPALYGTARSPKLGKVNAPRDSFDMRLLDAAKRRKLPVIGICRGCQLLNIAFGGTLWQDLPSEFTVKDVQHRNVYHKISIDPQSRLAKTVGATNVLVNSYHHQAVKDLAPGFRITAKSPDGVVEAIECDSYPAIGVQFHPEKMLCDEKDGSFAPFFRNLDSLFRR